MVNWNTKDITENILTDYFDSKTLSVDIYQKSEGDTGGSKISNRSSTHEIQIENTEDFNINRADITYSTLDKSSQVFITIKSEKNKLSIWEHTKDALLESRKLPTYEWDRIEFDDLSVDDPSYGIHESVIQITFIKKSEPI